MPAIRICSCCEVLNSHLNAILSVWFHQTAYRFTFLNCAGHRCMLRLSGVRTQDCRDQSSGIYWQLALHQGSDSSASSKAPDAELLQPALVLKP